MFSTICAACGHRMPRPAGLHLPAPAARKCPACGAVHIGRTEWVQLSAARKLLCFPEATALCAVLLPALPIGLTVCGVSAAISLPLGVAAAAGIGWVCALAQCNSARFLSLYSDSLRRTKSPDYLALLAEKATLTDESLPLGLFFTARNRALVAHNLQNGVVPGMDVFS